MTSLPSKDPLVALWQSAPQPDTHHLMQDLQHLNRLHQRLTRSVLAIVLGVAVLLLFEEATGRISSHGALSVLWTLGLVIAVAWHRRARGKRSDALVLDTVSLLKSMIARAKSDLFVARCLYAGVPCGGLVGFLLAQLAGIGVPPGARAVHRLLNSMQTGAGIAALVTMMVAGVILARSRRLQLQELSDKLRSIQADL